MAHSAIFSLSGRLSSSLYADACSVMTPVSLPLYHFQAGTVQIKTCATNRTSVTSFTPVMLPSIIAACKPTSFLPRVIGPSLRTVPAAGWHGMTLQAAAAVVLR